MASFKDKHGNSWKVNLDPILLGEIKSQLGVNLVDLSKDPLGSLVNDPEKLWGVVQMVCQEQYEKQGMTAEQFSKVLVYPPDEILAALRDAVIGFFPSGRASHVREVLEKFDQMASKTDEIATAKMQQMMNDPRVTETLSAKADDLITQALTSLKAQSAGI
jgi:hypothetical protein